MLFSQAVLYTVGIMASGVTGYKLDFYDFDGPPGSGCESDQLVWQDTWSSDTSAQCTPFKLSDKVKYIRIIKTDEIDNEQQVLFSSSDNCDPANAVRVQEGCFDISEAFPDAKSYQIVSRNIVKHPEKTVDSWWTPKGDAWSPIYIWTATVAGVTAVNAIRSSHGEHIAATVGRPLWAFVSSRFISSILIAQVFATGAVYLKQNWLSGNKDHRPCENAESTVNRLAKIIKKIAPVDEIEAIRATITLKGGRTMTISHQAVEEKVE
jgi:hypothetical protein